MRRSYSVPLTEGVRLRFLPSVTLGKIVFYLVLALFVIVTFAPIYWIILSAVTPIDDLFTVPLNYIPLHLSLVNFSNAAQAVPLGHEFVNSTVLSLLSAAISVVVAVLAGYAFARIKFPGSGLFLLGLLLSGFLPAIATVIPLFQLYQHLGLVDSLSGLLILYVGLLVPVSVWIMTSFIQQIPVELEEAAWVDGAGFITVLMRIIVPVLRPALATLFLINLITSWDEFFTPLIFSRTAATAPLTIGITQASVNPVHQTVAWGQEAAFGLIVILPVFALAMIFQKQIVEGLMAGALKG